MTSNRTRLCHLYLGSEAGLLVGGVTPGLTSVIGDRSDRVRVAGLLHLRVCTSVAGRVVVPLVAIALLPLLARHGSVSIFFLLLFSSNILHPYLPLITMIIMFQTNIILTLRLFSPSSVLCRFLFSVQKNAITSKKVQR